MRCVRVGGVCVLLIVLPLSACDVPAVLTKDCRWTDAEKAAVESAPLADFLGAPTGPLVANCDMSMPDDLWATAKLPDGAAMPLGWESRQVVGEWALAERLDPADGGTVLCYTSSSERWSQVQVAVFSDGLAEASMRRGKAPC